MNYSLQLKLKELHSKQALLCDCTYDYLILLQYLINKQQSLHNTDVSLFIQNYFVKKNNCCFFFFFLEFLAIF